MKDEYDSEFEAVFQRSMANWKPGDLLSKHARAVFNEGVRVGFRHYAHWKDGTQYVGTTGRSLADALADITDG